ncbi:MAG: arylsulfatase [Roseivirga sp.]
MRRFLALLLVTMFSLSCTEEERMPNVIFILADDMGYGDIQALNADAGIPTENLNRLASQGMHFTDAHSNSAVCTPTRYGLLTGRYAFRTRLKSGVLVGYDPPLIAQEQTTLGSLFSDNGYHTACIGKWHLGLDWAKKNDSLPLFTGSQWDDPNTDNVDYAGKIGGGPSERGFDYGYVIPSSLDIAPYCYINNGRLTKPMNGKIAGENPERGVFWRTADIQQDFELGGTLDHLTDRAVEYIDEQGRKKDQPFFLYFPLTAPHTPWLPTAKVRGKSQAGVYGDFVVQVDQTVGAVMKKLEDLGIEDETLIIFSSDNGSHWTAEDKGKFAHRANYIYSGMKSDVWEGGHRVPFIARWPGKIKAGISSNELVSMTDLMATFSEMLGTSTQAEDSNSILKLLTGEEGFKEREYTVQHSVNGVFAIRKGHWKLVDSKGSGGWTYNGKDAQYDLQLYNLEEDPAEQNNLVEKYPELVKELKAKVDEYKKL